MFKFFGPSIRLIANHFALDVSAFLLNFCLEIFDEVDAVDLTRLVNGVIAVQLLH
jgi:hypothetical protein